MTAWRDSKGRSRTRYSSNVYEWRGLVTAEAVKVRQATGMVYDGPVVLTTLFLVPRPKAHYRTGKFAGQIKDTAPRWALGGGDLDKYVRAVGDSITDAGLWRDDGQVVRIIASKQYISEDDQPGVYVRITPC